MIYLESSGLFNYLKLLYFQNKCGILSGILTSTTNILSRETIDAIDGWIRDVIGLVQYCSMQHASGIKLMTRTYFFNRPRMNHRQLWNTLYIRLRRCVPLISRRRVSVRRSDTRAILRHTTLSLFSIRGAPPLLSSSDLLLKLSEKNFKWTCPVK